MKRENRKFAGFGIMILGIIYGWSETAYFGWNWRSHSASETICDGIAFLIAALGWALVAGGKK